LDQDFILSPKDIEVQGEWITALTPWRDEEPGGWIDLSNKLVIPGLIDQHIHGCGGFDVEDASLEALAAMSEELARHGVTSFCPTVMARPIEGLPPILDMIRAGQRQGLPGAYVHGARLEGPYLSPLKKGAQKESCLSKPDAGEFLALWNRYPGLIKIVDLAPELEGAEDFIRRVRSRQYRPVHVLRRNQRFWARHRGGHRHVDHPGDDGTRLRQDVRSCGRGERGRHRRHDPAQ